MAGHDEIRFRARPPLRLLRHGILLWLGIAALLVPRSLLRADEFSQTTHYSVRMFSFGTLSVETRMGDVSVEGWDDPRLDVQAEKVVRASSPAKARMLYQRIQIHLEGQDKQIALRAMFPPRRLWRPFRGESKLSVNFTIMMPYDANLTLHCVDGDVTVRGLVGREVLRVNYGDVEIDVPDVYRLRHFRAHSWLGYVESDLHGFEADSAGFGRNVFFTAPGDQDIFVDVRMGGVFVYSEDE